MSETRSPAAGPTSGALPGVARRRYLTILFSDLVGSTPLAGTMLVEDYDRLAYSPLREAWNEVISAFGGKVNETRGDGAVAVFGWPEANENDGRMATLAALTLHERMRALDGIDADAPPLRLHSGIHSGLVLVREVDDRLELLGSAMNVAARLADAAKADEIIVSEATLGPDRGAFMTGERLHLSLKGKEQPIAAFKILDRAPEPTRYAARERGRLSPFVGRRRELERLTGIADRVASGGASFVSVVGPAGVGKTRLVSELLTRAGRTFQVFRGECDAHLGAEPLQPFLQILRSALGIGQGHAGGAGAKAIEPLRSALGAGRQEHGDVLLRLLAPAEAGGRRPPSAAAAASALQALLADGAGERPLALFIDDWQSADDASRKLLQALRDLAWPSLLVLLTTRGEASQPFDDFERLDLTPLTDEESAAAIRQVLPGANPFVIDDICTAAGGNPLFIEELCHSAAYGEQDFRTHGGSGWLDVLIESRFVRLPPAQADLLSTAAVIGNVIPVWLLQQATGCGADDPLVQALADEDFIFPGERAGTLRFKHGIARDVIYDCVGLRECRALHLRIAEALRQKGEAEGEEEYYEALAYHFGAGGDAAAAAHYAELAGDKAFDAAALDRALRQYRAALDALDRLPSSPEIERKWSRVARRFALAGVWDPMAQHLPILERAVERATRRDDPVALALAEHWLGYMHFGLGNSAEAIAHNQRALATARPLGNMDLTSQIQATLGQAHWEASKHQAAVALLDEAIAVMRQAGGRSHGAPVGFAYSLAVKGWVLADLGHFAQSRELFEEAIEEVRGLGHPIHASILSSYAVVCLWQGCLDEAVRVARECQQVSVRVRTFYMYAKTVATEAYARWVMSGGAEGVDQLEESTRWLEERGHNQFMSLNYGWLAETMGAAGKMRRARRNAALALRRARGNDRLGEVTALRAVARLSASQRDWERSDHYLQWGMSAAQARGSAHDEATTRLCAAEIALGRGRAAAALELLDAAEPAFAAMGMKWHAEQAARLRTAAG